MVPPAAPKIGDCFDNLKHAYITFAIANVTQLGVSVSRTAACESMHGTLICNRRVFPLRCPFKAVLGPTPDSGTRTTVLPSSVLYHNHDKMPQLRADPSWRPRFRCKIISEVFAKLDRSKPEVGRTRDDTTDLLSFA